jgi:hypothetical protein
MVLMSSPGAWAAERVQGTVERYLLTAAGRIEGVFLVDKVALYFPEAYGDAVAQVVVPGSLVEGESTKGDPKHKMAMRLAALRSGKTLVVFDEGQPKIEAVPLTTIGPVSGIILKWVVNLKGEPTRAILHDDVQVIMRPVQARKVYERFETQSRGLLEVSGVGTRNQYGAVVEASTVAFNDEDL